VTPTYRPYSYSGRAESADPVAAAARAAYEVLVSQYPSAQDRLDEEIATWLDRVPDGHGKRRGLELGSENAATILALRDGDGFDIEGTYTFESGPGAYQTTPPWDGFVLQPGFRFATPFGLGAAEQFRPRPPPRWRAGHMRGPTTRSPSRDVPTVTPARLIRLATRCGGWSSPKDR
jgi:hypothetical protein